MREIHNSQEMWCFAAMLKYYLQQLLWHVQGIAPLPHNIVLCTKVHAQGRCKMKFENCGSTQTRIRGCS